MDGGFFNDEQTTERAGAALRPLIIDSFGGGGGASAGIEAALGRSPDVAINHDPVALSMHEVNHPETLHLTNSVYAVDPRDLVTPGQRVGLLWASPDCKHHSKAKGGKPLDKNIRDLAWVVVHYAELIKPEVIMLENVEEFSEWCPLGEDQKPDKARKGETFRAWVGRLRRLGYAVEWRILRACDYGAPTIRRRLFVIARRDGRPIVWPRPTHAPASDLRVIHGHMKPYRTAADIIDWSLPCPSIFDTSEEIMAKHGLRAVRPLADNTLRRIARGVQRYVLEAKKPFIVVCNHAGDGFRGQGLGEPLATVTASRDATGLVSPVLAPFVTYGQQGGANRPAPAPFHTITASVKDQNAVVVPSLISVAHGYSGGRREYPLSEPIGTMSAGGVQHAVVAPTLVSYYGVGQGGQDRSRDAGEPVATVTTENRHALVSAFLAQHNGGPRNDGFAGRSAAAPLSTVTVRGTQQTVVAANMISMHGQSRRDGSMLDPVKTITAGGGHAGMVAAFLAKYYGTEQDPRLDDPLHTLTTKGRFGLVTVEIEGEEYAIVDIGMRMLTPSEQFAAQGFDPSYEIDVGAQGEPMKKTAQTRLCGNSVCPPIAQALVSANCGHLKVGKT